MAIFLKLFADFSRGRRCVFLMRNCGYVPLEVSHPERWSVHLSIPFRSALSFGYRSVIVRLSFGYPSVIVRLSFGYRSVIVRLSFG